MNRRTKRSRSSRDSSGFPRWDSVPANNIADPKVYDQLRRLASGYLKREGQGHPFEPADLVHEALLRIARSSTPIHFRTPGHFIAILAIVMRHVLIDYARSGSVFTRWQRVPLDFNLRSPMSLPWDAMVLYEALSRLAKADMRLYRVVEMRVFAGFAVGEVAAALSISTRTVKRDWEAAIAWLRGEFGVPAKAPASAVAVSRKTLLLARSA
jgi:RNA polymerase sigma factor (TIGR02999 family)